MLQSANRREWPDSALGCPEDGQVYLQVVTPGYELVFSDASQSQTYSVHTGDDGNQMLLCEDNQPTNLADAGAGAAPQPSPSPAPGAVAPNPASRALADKARQMLVQELGVDASAVTLQRVEAVEWRDSSLGCPQPGMNYLQVITPGYLIVLEAQGRSYEYHTNKSDRVVRCDQPQAPAGGAASDTSPLANTSWKLESLGDPGAPTAALPDAAVTLTFDGAKEAIGGNSGCNSYGGTYQVDGAKLTFGQIVGTLMACASQPVMQQESQYQQALAKVSQYTIDGDRLELTYDGTKVLRFRAAAPTS
jgi:heat shock protein HslJ